VSVGSAPPCINRVLWQHIVLCKSTLLGMRLARRIPNNVLLHNTICCHNTLLIQGGAEPTDTFQMVIDDIWKQEKISETVYKYVQICYLLPTNYKLIF